MSRPQADLPCGWIEVSLGEVASANVEQGGPGSDGDFTYVDIGSIDNRLKKITEPKALPAAKAPSRAKQRIRKGDVLVSMTRPNLNSVAMVPGALDGAVASTGFRVIRPMVVAPGWIFSHVRSPGFVAAMTSLVQGALYPAVRPADIDAYRIELPPLAEQQRIVARIHELSDRTASARSLLEAIPALLNQFRQSALAAAFRGDLTADWRAQNPDVEPASVLLDRIRDERRREWAISKPRTKYVGPESVDGLELSDLPDSWCWATLAELSSAEFPLCYGVIQPGEDDEKGVQLVRVCDLEDGRVNAAELRRIPEDVDAQYSRSRIRGGEVLVSVVGTIGRIAIAGPDLRGFNIARAIAKLTPLRSVAAEWLAFNLMNPEVNEALNRDAREVARKTLNLGTLAAVAVPLAPAEEMKEILARVGEQLARVPRVAAMCENARQQLDRLDQSILAKAFRGELVPQDPDDEPASVLLERIRAERAAGGGGKPRRGKRKAGA